MGYYDQVYTKRINKNGMSYLSRIQGKREKDFDNYLLRTPYRVDFSFDGTNCPGALEKYKQDDTKTLQYLLTKRELDIPNGTLLEILDIKDKVKNLMIYYLSETQASGYNKYVTLKMTHYITWKGRDGEDHSSWAYMFGQKNNMLKDEDKSVSKDSTIYPENLKLNSFILPFNEHIRKDDYLIVETGGIKEAYKVTGYDIQSTPGVEYVTIDPVYIRDQSPMPVATSKDNKEEFFWLNGGV